MILCNDCRICNPVHCGIIRGFVQKDAIRASNCKRCSHTRNSGTRGKHFIPTPPFTRISSVTAQKIPDDYSGIFSYKKPHYETLFMLHPTDLVSAGLTFLPAARL